MKNLIRNILRESDWDWLEDIDPTEALLDIVRGKGIYFDPNLSTDEDYKAVYDFLVESGLTPIKNTPREPNDFCGIYVYSNNKNEFIYTPGDYDIEEYEDHISGYIGRYVEIVDGVEFVEKYL